MPLLNVDAYREKYEHRLETYQDDPEQFLHDFKYGIAAIAVTLFAFWIRLIPRKGMQYMQALDPYMISRMAEAIVTEGHLPIVDVWRYVPYITPTFRLNLGDIYIPAYLYMLIEPFTGMDFVAWTQVYPALMGAGMVCMMYFIGKELFDRQAGVFAAFFLAAAPAVLHRSSAGWFEKEPVASLLMFTSIYFLTRAWKRKSWLSGIVSGVSLAVAMTSWGGTQFLLLLYPIVAFIVVFINEDIENVLIAFTPTLLLAHFLAPALNPGRSSLVDAAFMAAMGVLALVWARYLVEEYRLVDDAYYGYVVPGLTVLGGILAFLAPLYSQTIAGLVQQLITRVSQSSTGVIGGTVAENTPSSAGQVIGQLGVARVQNVAQLRSFYPFAEFFSGWTFAIVGSSALIVMIGYMLLKKYDFVDTVRSGVAYFAFVMTTLAFSAVVMSLLGGGSFSAFIFPLVWAFVGGGFLYFFTEKRDMSMENRWYMILPLLWILATLYGATQRSRLLFLTSHPVALMAGFGLSMAVTQLRHAAVWDMVAEKSEELDARRAFFATLVVLLIPVLVFNAAAAQSMAERIGGSPNQAWMENLDYMRTETPVDSVILSWWDYGYWFETIGGRSAMADGGNMGFYSDAIEDPKINMPLADFLTASDYTEHLDWMESLSVDYVVLDSTMIGKYSAVSTIHKRGGQPNGMQTFSCQRQNNRCAIQEANGQQYLVYNARGARILVPVQQQGNGISLAGAPMFQQQQGTAPVKNFCSPSGVMEFNVNSSRGSVPGCVAWHPFQQQRQLIYIPQAVMDSTLVRLYVMDAHNMPHFEEVQDNGFVKMWKVNYDAGANGSANVQGQ